MFHQANAPRIHENRVQQIRREYWSQSTTVSNGMWSRCVCLVLLYVAFIRKTLALSRSPQTTSLFDVNVLFCLHSVQWRKRCRKSECTGERIWRVNDPFPWKTTPLRNRTYFAARFQPKFSLRSSRLRHYNIKTNKYYEFLSVWLKVNRKFIKDYTYLLVYNGVKLFLIN